VDWTAYHLSHTSNVELAKQLNPLTEEGWGWSGEKGAREKVIKRRRRGNRGEDPWAIS